MRLRSAIFLTLLCLMSSACASYADRYRSPWRSEKAFQKPSQDFLESPALTGSGVFSYPEGDSDSQANAGEGLPELIGGLWTDKTEAREQGPKRSDRITAARARASALTDPLLGRNELSFTVTDFRADHCGRPMPSRWRFSGARSRDNPDHKAEERRLRPKLEIEEPEQDEEQKPEPPKHFPVVTD